MNMLAHRLGKRIESMTREDCEKLNDHEDLFWISQGFCPKRPANVYAIRSGDYVKFGVSTDPERRLAQIRAHNPHGVELLAFSPGSYELESYIHSKLKDSGLHVSNEWFKYEGLSVELAKELQNDAPDYSLLN